MIGMYIFLMLGAAAEVFLIYVLINFCAVTFNHRHLYAITRQRSSAQNSVHSGHYRAVRVFTDL